MSEPERDNQDPFEFLFHQMLVNAMMFSGIDLGSAADSTVVIKIVQIDEDGNIETVEPKPFDINSRISEIDQLIDKSLSSGDKESFMRYSRERNMLKLEL